MHEWSVRDSKGYDSMSDFCKSMPGRVQAAALVACSAVALLAITLQNLEQGCNRAGTWSDDSVLQAGALERLLCPLLPEQHAPVITVTR